MYYIGCKGQEYIVFQSDTVPTEKTHGHLYAYVIGCFRTKRGALWCEKYGRNNPHATCVDEMEKLARIK